MIFNKEPSYKGREIMKKIIIEKATEKKITNLFEKVGTQTNQASKKLTRDHLFQGPFKAFRDKSDLAAILMLYFWTRPR